jgi:hypothetical protein
MMRRMILAPALAALLATAAAAQPAAHAGAGRMGPPTAEMTARHEAIKKQHVEDLKTVLRLRPDQEAALAAFVAAHEPRRFERKLPEPGAMTTPQRLDDMAKMEAEMAAHHREAREALTKFYAALSPEQQKVFDALQRLKGGPGGHGGRRMMLMGRGGGPDTIMMMGRHGPGGRHEGPPGGPPHDDE